ncbi:hypothetical protein BDV96DRAFT_693461 [Lophiotrema nucula]|uniref:Uncharacterized protein n=1 Tax=Lophiotrema nucula TaxID=690887 RepID=A0A6A5YJM7_9PLEO|nr:hypothetical protein BDV96DRAFT_693461 [Lophiotrema nucula]
MASTHRPDIDLLRLKLIISCHEVVREEIKQKPLRNKREIRKAQWITDRSPDRMRFYVLDGAAFKLKQYGTAWEARLVASCNPVLDAGNGVYIYLNDHIDDLFKSFVPAFLKEVDRPLEDDLARNSLNATVVKEEKERLDQLKRDLKLPPETPDGSALYMHIFRAIMRIKAGKA